MADDSSSGMMWFLVGLGIGAAVGVLYAPRSGRETREAILNAANEGSGVVRDRAKQYREQAQDLYNRSREMMNQQKEQVRNAFEAGRQAYREATNEGGPQGSTQG